MQQISWLLLALVLGLIIPIQVSINSQLGRYLTSPLQATFFNFLVGLIFITLILFFSGISFPPLSTLRLIPKWLFMGGLLGVLFVTCGVILIPKIGAAAFVAAAFCGQILGALVIDHFGFFGVVPQSFSLGRALGLIFLLLGLFLSYRDKF